jgi:NADPH2 dehydrogenase
MATKVFTELEIGNTKIKNRIAMPPMCTYSAGEDGFVEDFHVIHYATRAIGGVGLIILEATPVEKSGRISGNDIGIWSDLHIEGLTRITKQIKENNCVAGIQLGHAGRKCGAKAEKVIYAPSPIAFSDEYLVPTEMTLEDIKRVVKAFEEGARRAKLAGFTFIQIHAAHGYLLSEFLSPLANKRTDEYGGSFENRVRFLGEVIDAIKNVFDGTLCIRVSAEDYSPEGNKVEDMITMINMIKDKGIDIVDVSTGGVAEVPISAYPGYQIKHAEAIKHGCNLPVIAGGLIVNHTQLEEIVSNGRADMVYVGRELLRNPYFALKASHDLKGNVDWNKAYERAKFR